MHQYSSDYDQKTIYFLLVSFSIVLTGIINYIFNLSGLTISITGFAVFGIIFKLFDKFLWKLRFLYKIGLIKTPNLNGIWKGTLSSSYDKFNQKLPSCIEIKQTWTHICIIGTFNQSQSYSTNANLHINKGARILLKYFYENSNSVTKSTGTMSSHSGVTILEFNLTEESTKGKYYNEPPENINYGELVLKRQEKK